MDLYEIYMARIKHLTYEFRDNLELKLSKHKFESDNPFKIEIPDGFRNISSYWTHTDEIARECYQIIPTNSNPLNSIINLYNNNYKIGFLLTCDCSLNTNCRCNPTHIVFRL